MTHISFSRVNAERNTRSDATGDYNLIPEFIAMAGGISRPESVRRRLEDAVAGKLKRPLGPFPEVAEACIDAGGSFHNVTRPLTVMLAHLRRRCTSKLPADLKDALMRTKRECDEAEALGLRIAFAVNGPAVSDLTALDKEAADAEIALARLREMTQDKIAEATR